MDIARPIEPRDLFSANGLVVVLTGGGSGIGLAMAAGLKPTAKKVYILGRRFDKLQEAAKTVDPEGKVIVSIQCDVTDTESIKKAAQQIESEQGYIDVLINNAGVTGPSHKQIKTAESIAEIQDILSRDWDSWSTTFAANTTAVAGVSAAFLHLLDAGNKRKGYIFSKGAKLVREPPTSSEVDQNDTRTSQIITISSGAAFNRTITLGLPYSASKAGALALSKLLSTSLAEWGIRSNAICPGYFPSEMIAAVSDIFPSSEIPAGRQGGFEDIVGTLLYVVGQSGAYLNGAVQLVDGGRLSVFPSTF